MLIPESRKSYFRIENPISEYRYIYNPEVLAHQGLWKYCLQTFAKKKHSKLTTGSS